MDGIVSPSDSEEEVLIEVDEQQSTEILEEDIRKSDIYRQLQHNYELLLNDYDAVDDVYSQLEVKFDKKEEELRQAIARAEEAESRNAKLNTKLKSASKELEKAKEEISDLRTTLNAIHDMCSQSPAASETPYSRSKKQKTVAIGATN